MVSMHPWHHGADALLHRCIPGITLEMHPWHHGADASTGFMVLMPHFQHCVDASCLSRIGQVTLMLTARAL
jgi:hypothetical protein